MVTVSSFLSGNGVGTIYLPDAKIGVYPVAITNPSKLTNTVDFTSSASFSLPPGETIVRNFTLQAAHTMSVGGLSIIRASGTVTLDGTVTGLTNSGIGIAAYELSRGTANPIAATGALHRGRFSLSPNADTLDVYGVVSSIIGAATAGGAATVAGTAATLDGYGGGGGGPAATGAGGNGGTHPWSAETSTDAVAGTSTAANGGGGGGGSSGLPGAIGGGSDGSQGSAGTNSIARLIIICDEIVFNGTFNFNGGNASGPSGVTAGGGRGGNGGGNGGFLLCYANLITHTTGAVSANGGNGTNGTAGESNAGAGGGGGGGFAGLIWWQAATITLTAGTRTATPGTAGSGGTAAGTGQNGGNGKAGGVPFFGNGTGLRLITASPFG